MLRSTPHTVNFDVVGLHNAVTVDWATLAMAANEDGQDIEEVSNVNSPAAELTTLNKNKTSF